MNIARTSTVIMLSLLGLSSAASAQSNLRLKEYVIRVESTNPDKPHIRFSLSYAYGAQYKDPVLIMVEKQTPFELKFSAENYVFLVQDKSGNRELRARLTNTQSPKDISVALTSQSRVIMFYGSDSESGIGIPGAPGSAHAQAR